jgi:hypothetical protein
LQRAVHRRQPDTVAGHAQAGMQFLGTDERVDVVEGGRDGRTLAGFAPLRWH